MTRRDILRRTAAGFCALTALGIAPGSLRAKPNALIEMPVKPPVPALRLRDLDGKLHDIEDYKGRVVVVNFWATWCAPCRKELPSLDRAWTALKRDGVQLLAVSMGDSAEKVDRFLKRYPVDIPILVDERATLKQSWQLQGMPTTYVVAPNGVIYFGAIGEREWDSREILDQILALTRASSDAR